MRVVTVYLTKPVTGGVAGDIVAGYTEASSNDDVPYVADLLGPTPQFYSVASKKLVATSIPADALQVLVTSEQELASINLSIFELDFSDLKVDMTGLPHLVRR